jgi:hypothetical protein
MVVFGGGYALERLAGIDWLRGREVLYWGDIDTHGFAILDRVRARMPHVRSLLMDAATMLAHRHVWGSEESDKRFLGDLARLTETELRLFHAVRDDLYQTHVRLEQERIGYGWMVDAMRCDAHGMKWACARLACLL